MVAEPGLIALMRNVLLSCSTDVGGVLRTNKLLSSKQGLVVALRLNKSHLCQSKR